MDNIDLETIAKENGASFDDIEGTTEETAIITAEEWKNKDYYAATIKTKGKYVDEYKEFIVKSHEEYLKCLGYIRKDLDDYEIIAQEPQTRAQYFPGLLTYEDAVNEFKTADGRFLEFKSFPQFSKTAKIKKHDSVVIAADTGAGKSALALNFINDLNKDYPVLYFNLEMNNFTVLKRLVAIRSGMELKRIEGYQKDEKTAAEVNKTIKDIASGKPLQMPKNVYNLKAIEAEIKKATEDREEITIVFIDHALLIKTGDKVLDRDDYRRFTHISEELRRIAQQYNIILFALCQQNRNGKDNEKEPPKNSSLKNSGSWENDATQIIFLWKDPELKEDQRRLILSKNRDGEYKDFIVDFYKYKQTFHEEIEQPPEEWTVKKRVK